MTPKRVLTVAAVLALPLLAAEACKKTEKYSDTAVSVVTAVTAAFGENISLARLENYAAQAKPAYITRDNTGANAITDAGATLGRVLFYDKNLSVTNTIACASCHKQEFAFSDNAIQSPGANGLSARHSMRLANARFSQETRFFWDKRAATLENQVTQPIQNHSEMGYSGLNGDPGIAALIAKLQAIGYYKELFTFVYGDATITEVRLQNALAQFVRSIQSFDSRFDTGLAAAGALNRDFPNFTPEENAGKLLFVNPPSPPGSPVITGAGCQGCHRAPEFDIDPNSRNNGVTGVIGNPALVDVTNTRAPSLRNLLNASGRPNGPFMHTGGFAELLTVLNHYNQVTADPANTNLDNRLMGAGQGQNLRLSVAQRSAIVAFLCTLSGNDVYTNKKWSDPFVEIGSQ